LKDYVSEGNLYLGVLAGTGLRAQETQLDMEVPKTLALMSRVADVGLETVDIAMGRKKMKAAAVMRTAVRETAVDLRTAAVNVQKTAVDLRTAAVNTIMGSLEEADHLRPGKASLIGEELLVVTPEPMSMKAIGWGAAAATMSEMLWV
jgi:hypothetical protein